MDNTWSPSWCFEGGSLQAASTAAVVCRFHPTPRAFPPLSAHQRSLAWKTPRAPQNAPPGPIQSNPTASPPPSQKNARAHPNRTLPHDKPRPCRWRLSTEMHTACWPCCLPASARSWRAVLGLDHACCGVRLGQLLLLQRCCCCCCCAASHHRVLACPLARCVLVAGPVRLVDVRNLWHEGVVWIGVSQQRRDGQQHL